MLGADHHGRRCMTRYGNGNLCVAYRKLMGSGKERTRGYSASDDDCSQIGCLASPCQGNLPLQQGEGGMVATGQDTCTENSINFPVPQASLFPLRPCLWCSRYHLCLGDGVIPTSRQLQVVPSRVSLGCNVSVRLQFEAKFLAHLATSSSHLLSISIAACLSTNPLDDRPDDAN